MKSKLPKRLARKTIYQSKWINLHRDKVLMPSGKIIEEYHFLDYPNQGVVVLLENNNKEICLIKSLRYVTQEITWELPAGGNDKNESILETAKRETFEETGYIAKNLQQVYTFHPSNGMSNNTINVVFGKVANLNQATFDTDEVSEVHWLSVEQIKKLIEDNEINCGIALSTLLLYINNLV